MPDAPAPATVSYKWPSKVLRYKITCPFQRMLVVKHEAQIDWDGQIHGTRIESVRAFDDHIKEVMLPAIHRWMDPADEKSHYCRQIDLEKMLANPPPHIQVADDLHAYEGRGPEIRLAPGLWKDLPEGYRQDECLQRVHHYATCD